MQTGRQGKIIAEINITPLTDVVLVLLIIFMISTPFLVQSSIKVNLPKAHAAQSKPGKDLTLTISSDGKMYLGKTVVTIETLADAITAEKSANDIRILVVRADAGISYGEVVRAMDAAKRAGVEKLALATESPR